MAISLRGVIPRIMHQPVGPVSDREEGCRWSGECRWLKPREPLWREGARYANISSFFVFFFQSAWFLLLFQLQNGPVFCIANWATRLPRNQRVLATFINYESILGLGNPGHNISMVTIWKGQGQLNDFIAIRLFRKIYGLALEHFRWQALTTLHRLGCVWRRGGRGGGGEGDGGSDMHCMQTVLQSGWAVLDLRFRFRFRVLGGAGSSICVLIPCWTWCHCVL